jgi:acyl-CoA synthetase (NDP forming)
LEYDLVNAARKAGITILGPNTMGIANPHINLHCSASTAMPRAGKTAIVAQSGNLGTQLLAFATEQGIGIRGFCGSGNEAMVSIEDFLEGFEVDEKTRVVLLYIESVKNGRRFFEAAQRVSCRKPVVLLKGGRTSAGKRAAASHTGAMLSDDRVFDAMCRQSGVIKVDQPMELLDLAAALASIPLPRGPRVAIMTWGGGWGVVTCDLCQLRGLEVPALDQPIVNRIDTILPPYWSRANPVDLVGDPDLSTPMSILEELVRWDGCDAVINLGMMGRRLFSERFTTAVAAVDPKTTLEILENARRITADFELNFIRRSVDLMQELEKPVVAVSLLKDHSDQTVHRIPGSRYNGLVYETPERAVNTLEKLVAYKRFLRSGF